MARKTVDDVANFGDLIEPLPESESLKETMVDKTFVATHVEFLLGNYGEMAILTVEGKAYRTGSKVLVKQLKTLEEHINQGGVRMTLRAVKNYLTFA
jgi:hypothetical protein